MGADILDLNTSRFGYLVTDWLVENMILYRMLFDCYFLCHNPAHLQDMYQVLHLGLE